MRIVQGRALNREVERVTARRQELAQNVDRRVRTIIDDVRRSGDSALRKYGKRWDGLKQQDSFKVPEKELKRALASVDPEFRSALEKAAANIRQFCQWQKPAEFLRTIQPGIKVGQIIRPLEAVGCYVPGGRYPLPSSLLMTVIPAQVAGVRRVVVASPKPAAETLAAAALLGVAEFYRIGGAQAIAALAYGTEAISKVNKIGVREHSRSPQELIDLLRAHQRPRGLTAVRGGMIALLDGMIHQQDIRRPLGDPPQTGVASDQRTRGRCADALTAVWPRDEELCHLDAAVALVQAHQGEPGTR